MKVTITYCGVPAGKNCSEYQQKGRYAGEYETFECRHKDGFWCKIFGRELAYTEKGATVKCSDCLKKKAVRREHREEPI